MVQKLLSCFGKKIKQAFKIKDVILKFSVVSEFVESCGILNNLTLSNIVNKHINCHATEDDQTVEIYFAALYKIIPYTETCKVLDHTFVHNYTCISKNVNRTLNLGSKEIFFQPGVNLTNYHAHVVLYRKFATIYRQFMVDIHIDKCAIFAGNKTVVTQYINIERRHKYGNMNEPCPISGRRYEFNVPTKHTELPEIFPSGEYRVDSKTYTIVGGEKEFLTLTQSYGEVKYTTAEQWRK